MAYNTSFRQDVEKTINGGKGSGNFDHLGRDGEVGGSTSRKQAQFDLLQKTNPMEDDYHTGIRSVDEIKTFTEAMEDSESFAYPDFTEEDAQEALKKGTITIYRGGGDWYTGCFVTPSKMQAQDYNGGKEPISMEVKLEDVAWINTDEGNWLPLDKEEK